MASSLLASRTRTVRLLFGPLRVTVCLSLSMASTVPLTVSSLAPITFGAAPSSVLACAMIGIWRTPAASAIPGTSEATSSPTMILLMNPLLSVWGRTAKVFEVSTCASQTAHRSDGLWSQTCHPVNHHGVAGRVALVGREPGEPAAGGNEAGITKRTSASHTRYPPPAALRR